MYNYHNIHYNFFPQSNSDLTLLKGKKKSVPKDTEKERPRSWVSIWIVLVLVHFYHLQYYYKKYIECEANMSKDLKILIMLLEYIFQTTTIMRAKLKT